jgi:predicted site-specific integrase-resolvase
LILFNLVAVELLRLAKAARRFGVQTVTLRLWAIDGKIPFVWVGRERRFSCIGVENMKRGGPAAVRPGRVVLYVRVCGSTGRETSLQAREAELRATASGGHVVVVHDRGSGLQADRPGLNRVLRLAAEGSVERCAGHSRGPVGPVRDRLAASAVEGYGVEG